LCFFLFSLLPKIKTDEGIAAFASAATVTRLHLRYTKDSAPDDLVFKTAEPIHGGIPEAKVAGPAKANRFQGRYLMWVQGCGSSGGIGGMFSPPPTLSGPSATSTKLIDPFEQIIVNDVPELDVKAVPLDKDAKPLPYTGPSAPTFTPPPPPTPRAQMKVLEVEVKGSLDKDIVRRIVQRNRAQAQYCFERALLINPGLGGKVVVQFLIGPEGTTSNAKLVQGLGSPVDECVVSRVRTWQFPKPEGGPVAVTLPMLFQNPNQ
jgi:TonB family protein